MREEIGRKIAAIRKKKGLSMRQLAELTGLNHSNIGKIELGKYSVGVDILGRICDALGCELNITEKED
jgi:transcriptional regulator with XRE-family HTH domain